MTWRLAIPETLVARAVAQEPDAVRAVAEALLDPMYRLARRFFGEPADAEDAAQEVIIRVLKGLPTFQGRSSFASWCYRVAANHCLSARRGHMEMLSLEEGEQALAEGLEYDRIHGTYDGPDAEILAEEVKLSCTSALLVCLSRPLRMAYILADILGVPGEEGACILDIEPATFRKRRSMARKRLRAFLAPRCGIYDPSQNCRCERQVAFDLKVGWIKSDELRFAERGTSRRAAARRLETGFRVASIFLAHPDTYAPERLRDRVLRVLDWASSCESPEPPLRES